MIIAAHTQHLDRIELAVRVDADDAQEIALGAIGGATVTRDRDDDHAPQPTVLVALSWPPDADSYLEETKLLIESALQRAAPAPAAQLPGVGEPL